VAVGPVGPGKQGGGTRFEDEAAEGSRECCNSRPDRARARGTAGGGSDGSAITEQ